MSGDIIPMRALHPFHSHTIFLIPFFWLWPNLSGCSSPPGKNQCPRSSTLDPERVRGRTLPKSSQAQKPSKSWPWPVPLGKSEATINVCTFPGSLPRCDTIRHATHTHLHPRKAKKKLRRPVNSRRMHFVFFFGFLPVKHQVQNFSFGN